MAIKDPIHFLLPFQISFGIVSTLKTRNFQFTRVPIYTHSTMVSKITQIISLDELASPLNPMKPMIPRLPNLIPMALRCYIIILITYCIKINVTTRLTYLLHLLAWFPSRLALCCSLSTPRLSTLSNLSCILPITKLNLSTICVKPWIWSCSWSISIRGGFSCFALSITNLQILLVV